MMNLDFLKLKLTQREKEGNLRVLKPSVGLMDFVSNDYLGLSANAELAERIKNRMEERPIQNGGTGSRLLSGNHPAFDQLEAYLCKVFYSEACLVFNSGYSANQALVASVADAGDTILYDQLAHVCLKEGAWLSKAETVAFRHNDLEDLEVRLQRAKGRKFVVTETVFSMDGDIAPLLEIVDLCEKYDGYLIVDEAHSTGTFGPTGAGLLVELGLANRVFARVYTFGKAMGVHGACVAGSKTLVDYLINFGRPFIYTTSLPPHSIVSIEESFRYLSENEQLQNVLKEKINLFAQEFGNALSTTSIQPIMIGSNEEARAISAKIQSLGYDVRPILSPTVQRGTERLRISLHVHNTDAEIVGMAKACKELAPMT